MGKEKGGFLTPKAIANRIKAKGLQKLRWYCQMCQKQCRDENGFKCHLMSESHQRQLLLFAENPDEYIDTFSKEFLEGYLEVLKRRCGTKRIHANIIYQEYIGEKDHTHMNATQWETLTEFVKWTGREGYCTVDQTEKGWYVQYIDKDPEAIAKQMASEKKEKMDMDDEEKTAKFIQQQIERAAKSGKEQVVHEATELQREDEEEKVTFSLGGSTKKKDTSNLGENALKSLQKKPLPSDSESVASSSSSSSGAGTKRKGSALSDIMQMEEKKKEKQNRKDYWLHSGIVVKIVTKKLGKDYYKAKGVVREVIDRYGAVVKMLDSGDKLKIDQAHVETVIPAIGKPVLVVNGAYRGSEAELVELNQDAFSCTVRIRSGALNGRTVDGLQYEDISKLHTS